MQRVERIAFTLLIAGILAAAVVLALMLTPGAQTRARIPEGAVWARAAEGGALA